MQVFFSSLQLLEAYTHSLNSHPKDDSCQHCLKNDQWVSHGYVYKRSTSQGITLAGKRIICSTRYGRHGCGRTRQLYLDHCIPGRRHTVDTVIMFIGLLIKGIWLEDAYREALQDHERDSRHAWRWINGLYKQLGRFRSAFNLSVNNEDHYTTPHHRRLRILLPTLSALLRKQEAPATIQFILQSRFF